MRMKRAWIADPAFRAPAVLFLLLLCLIPTVPAGAVTRTQILSGLQKGGLPRRQAIWYIYQQRENDLLRNAVQYLFLSQDFEDHMAIFHVLVSYGQALENYLPDWYSYLDRYMGDHTADNLPEDLLISYIKLAMEWKEHRMIYPLSILAAHPRSGVRQAAYEAMSSFADDNLIPVLLRLIMDARPVKRLYALEGAARFTDRRLLPFIQRLLSDPSKSVRIYAIRAFVEQPGSVDMNYLIINMYLKDEDAEVRQAVIETIGKKAWRNQSYILYRALSDSSSAVRASALEAVALLKDTNAAFHISRQLETETDQVVKSAAVETLLGIGSGGGGSGLASLIVNEREERLRLRAALACGILKERGALPALMQAVVSDSSRKVRLEAAGALGRLADPRSTGPLAEAVRNGPDYEVKSAALLAMAEINNEDSQTKLNDLAAQLRDPALVRQIRLILRRMRGGRR